MIPHLHSRIAEPQIKFIKYSKPVKYFVYNYNSVTNDVDVLDKCLFAFECASLKCAIKLCFLQKLFLKR